MPVKHTVKNRHGKLIEMNLTPVKAIRKYCVEQCCYSEKEVKHCTVESCALFPFRLGKNPSVQGKIGNVNALDNFRKENSI